MSLTMHAASAPILLTQLRVLLAWLAKMAVGAVLLGLFETSIAKMRVFRVSEFLAAALLLGLLAVIFLYVSKGL